MTVSFEQIEPRLSEWRSFVLRDMELITREKVGGNFSALTVATIACDRLAKLWDNHGDSGELAFARMLPEAIRPVATSLYDALRHGVVHEYEPKLLEIDGRKLGVIAGWDESSEDWIVGYDSGAIVINARGLKPGLEGLFDEFQKALEADGALRDRFHQHTGRKVHVVRNPREIAAWKAIIEGETRR